LVISYPFSEHPIDRHETPWGQEANLANSCLEGTLWVINKSLDGSSIQFLHFTLRNRYSQEGKEIAASAVPSDRDIPFMQWFDLQDKPLLKFEEK
jgi:hypothetical protein